MAMTPRIVFSDLSKRWFIMTRYTRKEGVDAKDGRPYAYYVASVKHDVTDQMEAILQSPHVRKRKRT
jgi:hypothetical protein